MSTSVVFLSLEKSDYRNQKAFFSSNFMSLHDINSADPVCLVVGSVSYICQAWIKKDLRMESIEISPLVFKSKTLTGFCSKTKLECQKNDVVLKKLNALKMDSIKLNLVVKHISSKTKLMEYLKDVEDSCKKFLCNLTVGVGYVVACSESWLDLHFGISMLEVISSDIDDQCYGSFTRSTKIEIEEVLSNDEWEVRCVALENKLGGLSREINLIKKAINLKRDKFLIWGPTGCGKTSLVRCLAAEHKAVLVEATACELIGTKDGDALLNLQKKWEEVIEISRVSRCFFLIDNLDIFGYKMGEENEQEKDILARILSSAPEESGHFVIFATTNNISLIDNRLKSQFPVQVLIGIPRLSGRIEILESLLSDKDILSNEVDLRQIAADTVGFTGADLLSLVKQATLFAVVESGPGTSSETVILKTHHFNLAVHQQGPSQKYGDIFVDSDPISWDNIGGYKDVKEKISQAICWPLQHPEAFRRYGLTPSKGVLLSGPPGCGKTTLVRAAANSCNINFLSITAAQLYSPYLGDSEKRLVEVFQQARSCAPSIIFIDEIDSVVGSPSLSSDSQGSVQDRVLTSLLNLLDGIGIEVHELSRSMLGDEDEMVDSSEDRVIVVAATNRHDLIDRALIRPGRFEEHIYVYPPDYEARLQILERYTKNLPKGDLDIVDFARKTENFTGADLENLCKQAYLLAVTSANDYTKIKVENDHFISMLREIKPSLQTSVVKTHC